MNSEKTNKMNSEMLICVLAEKKLFAWSNNQQPFIETGGFTLKNTRVLSENYKIKYVVRYKRH